jgi:hypothetical protein
MRTKKALTVATALTGVTAGAAALLPATAAYASGGGWKINITMGAAVSQAHVCGYDLKDQFRCESAFNPTGARLSSVPFTDGGVVRTFLPQQQVRFSYSGPTIGFHDVGCVLPGGGTQMLWFVNANRYSC